MGKYTLFIIIGAIIGVVTTLGQMDKIIEIKLKEDQVEYSKRKAELIELELRLLEKNQ